MRIVGTSCDRRAVLLAISGGILFGGAVVLLFTGGLGGAASRDREAPHFRHDPERTQKPGDLSGFRAGDARAFAAPPEKGQPRIQESGPGPAAPTVSGGVSSRPASWSGNRNNTVPAPAEKPSARWSPAPATTSSPPVPDADIPASAGSSVPAENPVSGRNFSGVPGVAGSAFGAAANPVAQNTTKAMDPSAAGNSLTSGGQQVSVESIQQTPDGTNLDLAISPAAISSANLSQGVRGFTHEQELFRMKWGWENYDLAQRAAREVSPSP